MNSCRRFFLAVVRQGESPDLFEKRGSKTFHVATPNEQRADGHHRFGSKEGLLTAAARSMQEQVIRQRSQAVAGDLPAAISNLVEHYEGWGDRVVHLLSQEAAVPAIHEIMDRGRALHVEWVERIFAHWLPTDPTCAAAGWRSWSH